MMPVKRKVIVVTDGDTMAQKAVEIAAKKINARTISASGGNPTPLRGEKIAQLVKEAHHDPVVVMFDDRGLPEKGKGEKALEILAQDPEIEIIGALAVASNTEAIGVKCNCSITKEGQIIKKAVDKSGDPCCTQNVVGDTVDILEELDIPIIIGIGDIGKMNGRDDYHGGAKVTTKALEYILSYRGEEESGQNQ